MAVEGHKRKCVIELQRRRHIGIDFGLGIDQNRKTVQSLRLEHRFEKRGLVLAVAVTILQNLRGSVRLVAPNAERETHVTNVSRDPVVERASFIEVSALSANDLVSLSTHLSRGDSALALEV